MTIMRVHVSHLSDIPDFQTTIIRHCIKLIIFSVKFDRGNGVSVADKGLDLFLVVNVPDADNAILSTAN